ncbi:MAG: type II secretion system protein [Lachnospiraceae bacterium]|nr:type II secretion system protein [Lachnospiraceae bacterium]
MKNIGKVRAFLTEFVLVILFFSLSAVIALQLFLKANDKSEQSRNLTMAYMVAEQTAEAIKSVDVDESLEELLNKKGCWYDKDWVTCGEAEAEFVLSLKVVAEKTVAGELMDVVVVVEAKNADEPLCELPVTIYRSVMEGGKA